MCMGVITYYSEKLREMAITDATTGCWANLVWSDNDLDVILRAIVSTSLPVVA